MSWHLSHGWGIRNSAGRTNRGVVDIDWIALDVDCIGVKLAYLLDCIGLGDFGSRWVQNWIELHSVSCVAFYICDALQDWIVWAEWILRGLLWMWIALDWKFSIFVELHWIAFENKKQADGYRLDCNWVGLGWIGHSAWHCWWDSFTSENSNLSNVNHGRETVFFGSVQKLGL